MEGDRPDRYATPPLCRSVSGGRAASFFKTAAVVRNPVRSPDYHATTLLLNAEWGSELARGVVDGVHFGMDGSRLVVGNINVSAVVVRLGRKCTPYINSNKD